MNNIYSFIHFILLFFFSGRTSRREIRKLLWERLFWRIKRAKVGRHGSKVHTHSFLFDDDDDDTERSIATTAAATPYCALTIHSQNRSSQKNSNNNYPIHLTQRSSFFTCCGYTIDLSNKHSLCSSTGDIISRRSTICKSSTNPTSNNNNNNNNNNNSSPKKNRNYSHSPVSLSSFDRNLRHQTISLRLNDDDDDNNNNNPRHQQQTSRRRATTVIHCFRHIPSSTVTSTSITNHSLTLNKDSIFIRRSISEERTFSSIEIPPLDTSDTPMTTITGGDNPKTSSSKDITDSTVFVPNHLDDKQLPAYIVETC